MGATMNLAGRTAIVTGASRGLGRAIALALAAEGALVVAAARTEAVWDARLPGTVHETVAQIEQTGGRGLAVPTDLADEAALEHLVERAREEFGPVGILVNNAAVTMSGRPGTSPRPAKAVRRGAPPSFLGFPLRGYRLHMAVNVFAPYRLMQLVLPDMVAAGRGAIVNVSSDAAFKPGEGPYASPGRPALFAYGSTKAALHSLTQAVAVEFAASGVSANVLVPSRAIPTPGAMGMVDPQFAQAREWGSETDFAAAAVRLVLADPLERTGQILFHDDVLNPHLGRRGFLSTES